MVQPGFIGFLTRTGPAARSQVDSSSESGFNNYNINSIQLNVKNYQTFK